MNKNIIQNDSFPGTKGPYSVALTYGDLLFISGQGPAHPDTNEIVEGDFEEQARVTFENVRIILEGSGSSLSKALKVTVYLGDMRNFEKMNAIYGEYFRESPPVRTTIQAGLPFDIGIELDVTAHL